MTTSSRRTMSSRPSIGLVCPTSVVCPTSSLASEHKIRKSRNAGNGTVESRMTRDPQEMRCSRRETACSTGPRSVRRSDRIADGWVLGRLVNEAPRAHL